MNNSDANTFSVKRMVRNQAWGKTLQEKGCLTLTASTLELEKFGVTKFYGITGTTEIIVRRQGDVLSFTERNAFAIPRNGIAPAFR